MDLECIFVRLLWLPEILNDSKMPSWFSSLAQFYKRVVVPPFLIKFFSICSVTVDSANTFLRYPRRFCVNLVPPSTSDCNCSFEDILEGLNYRISLQYVDWLHVFMLHCICCFTNVFSQQECSWRCLINPASPSCCSKWWAGCCRPPLFSHLETAV